MIDSYQITHAGRTWHGNVDLSEYHLFERDGTHCLLRVGDMAATAITPALARSIANLIPRSGHLIPDSLMQDLYANGLVAREKPAVPVEAGRSGQIGAPVVTLEILLAQRCNMRCTYCYGGDGEYGKPGMMGPEIALAAVDWLMENSLDAEQVSVSFFGGEPLLNFPVLQQVVTYARQQAVARGKQVAFAVTTNASVLTDPMIRYLRAENINPLISFDGPPEVQNRQRPFRNGRGSYDRVFGNVQKLRKVFPILTARATIWGDADHAAIRQGLELVGFTAAHLTPASPAVSREGRAIAVAEPGTSERTADRQLAYERGEVARLFAAIRDRSLEKSARSLPLGLLVGLFSGHKRYGYCAVGRAMRAVSVSGDLYPCHRFVGQEQYRLGHLRDYRAGALNDYHRAVVDNLSPCRGCWARYFCGGGCLHDHQARTGDPFRPDPRYCQDTKTLTEDLIHGWCQLNEADHVYLRQQADALVPDEGRSKTW